MPQRAIGYCRVSTEQQASEGVSLAAQRAGIDAWGEANNYAIVTIYEDRGLSAASMTRREGLHAALQATTKGMALVTYSISRLSRSTQDMLAIAKRLEKQGADLVSLTEKIDTTSAAGRMVFRLLSVLAEFERDQISERTTTALRHKQRIGEIYGPVPFGYHAIEGRLVEAPAETRVVGDLLRMRQAGASLRTCADHLNRCGVATKQGGRVWHASSVREVLLRQAPVVARGARI